MKKIAIITIYDNANYGNRLQNFALQEFIINNRFGLPITIKNYDWLNDKSMLHAYLSFVKFKFFSNNYKPIRRHFKQFNKNIRKTLFFFTGKSRSLNGYDYYIVGGDQVFNPDIGRLSNLDTLSFVDSQNKISFSASFGINKISYNREIAEALDNFKALSVREEAGAKIIKDLTGRDATVLVDPTMLLTVDEWRKVSKKPKGAKDGYILTYFLSPKCEEAIEQLEKIREDREVYELLNPDDTVVGKAGPSEFLWLFDHADLILTDSFHACVFSFLFDKPFIVYDRNWDEGDMNSRLETLLSKFQLERKYANSELQNDIWEHDYKEGYKQLELERKKSINFLKEALEG